MSYRALAPEDIEVFSEAIAAFFQNMTREPAVVRTAYLLEGDASPLCGDFNGVIQVSGGFRGSITFCASRAMLARLLDVIGEREHSTDRYLDVVGEIANMMSGRARRHFGAELGIVPPVACVRDTPLPVPPASGRPFAIPLRWRSFEADLIVHLDVRPPRARAGATRESA